jgi:trk system potassium uptake protein TrkH
LFDLRPVLYVFAFCLFAEGLFMLLPALLELGNDEGEAAIFLASAAIAVFVGGALALTTRQHRTPLSLRQTFLLTPLCWFGLPVFGALPFMFGQTHLSFTDAYFETVSGFTTTGSTVIVGLDSLGPGIQLWRGLLLALGGVGFIVIALAVLPILRIGGMQIMRTESSDRSEKVLPRASQIAAATATTYAVLAGLSAVALWFCGMTPLEAIVHAMSATSTGGFSTSDLSIGNFSAPTHWVAMVSMLAGALPFALLYRSSHGEYRALWRDSQVRAFFLFLLAVILPLGFWLWLDGIYPDLETALRHSALNVVSIVTTTGFASTDYQLWGGGVLPIFLFLSLVGGCTGSTTGAVKIFRWQILFGLARRQLVRAVYPNRVLAERYNGKPLPPDVPASVGLFLFLYLGLSLLFTVALAATGLDFTTALSSAISALGNIGPGLGETVGPAGNFVPLPDSATWMLSIAMVMGRLELLTVLVLLDPRFWRR